MVKPIYCDVCKNVLTGPEYDYLSSPTFRSMSFTCDNCIKKHADEAKTDRAKLKSNKLKEGNKNE